MFKNSFFFAILGIIFVKSHQALETFIPISSMGNNHLPALEASGQYGYSKHISEKHLAYDLYMT